MDSRVELSTVHHTHNTYSWSFFNLIFQSQHTCYTVVYIHIYSGGALIGEIGTLNGGYGVFLAKIVFFDG